MGFTKVAAAGMTFVASAAFAGPDWIEVGDAGFNRDTAQITRGAGGIQTISGDLGGAVLPDYEDCYLIKVLTPNKFEIRVLSADFDAQLFIFHLTVSGGAYGLLANDNEHVETLEPRLVDTATDETGAVLDLPGLYMVSVAGAGRMPTSITGDIFEFADPTEISGADGPGGLNRHTDWAGEGATGSYSVGLSSCGFAEVPAPGAGALLAVGAVGAARRRRGSTGIGGC